MTQNKMEKVRHLNIDQHETEEISTMAIHRLKELIEWMKNDAPIYSYKGKRIVENLYVKGLWRYTSEYKALVNELEKRNSEQLAK